MKISKLLATRQALLRQTQLANLAYAYMTLENLAERIAAAKLRGLVRLQPADPRNDCYWASLTALEGNQSVIEEHFADQDIMELAESISFWSEGESQEVDFRLEELADQYAVPIRQLLEQSGVTFDKSAHPSNVASDSAD